jgi:hypothetical protein
MRLVILFLVLAAGCSADPVITTEDYDQSCEEANDCMTVYVGDVCACSCEIDAINYTQSTLWAQERSRRTRGCDEVLDCQPCPVGPETCDDSVCVAHLSPPPG